MFLELIATFCAGLGAAGAALVLNRLTGGRLPRWAMPVLAGAAMLGVTISNEYSWGDRTAGGLPAGVVVVERVEDSKWWQPWTYLWPQTVRLVAADLEGARAREDASDVKLLDLYLFARWQAPTKVPQLAHCGQSAWANPTDKALANPENAAWMPADPGMFTRICEG